MTKTMVCAVSTHLLLIGGNPAPSLILLPLPAVILWLWKSQAASLLGRSTASDIGGVGRVREYTA